MADPRSASLLTASQTPSTTDSFGCGPSSQRPTNPKKGFPYWDTTLNRLVVFTPVGWQIVGVQPAVMVGFGSTAQRPPAPPPGFVYYDTTLQAQYTWTGNSWILSSQPPATQQQPAMVGGGTTSQRPANPPFGFVYFDSTLQRQVQWAGAEWIVIGPSTPVTPPTPGNPPVITSSTSGFGVVGTPFSYQITATNNPTSFGAVGLPSGLSISASGLISGTPVGASSGYVTLSATNSYGTGNLNFYILITTSGSGIPTITSPTSASGVVGTFFSYQITGTNFPSSFITDSSAALGAVGLSLNPTTGVISGTPTGEFNQSITIGALNSQGTGTTSLNLVIDDTPVTSGRFTSVKGFVTVFQSYAAILGCTPENSSPSTLTFTVTTAGVLPPGVTWQIVNPNGSVIDSGTTEGGETSIVSNQNIALGGGYTAVVSTTSSSFDAKLEFNISGGSRFLNGSVRGFVAGPQIIGSPIGSRLQLIIQGLVPSSKIRSVSFSEVGADGSVTPVSLGRFTVSFNGDTSQNPKTDWSSGLSDMRLIGAATNNFSVDGILSCDG